MDQPAVGEGIERNARQPQPGFGTASLWPYMLHWFSGRLCTGRTAGGASARVEEICRFTGRAAGPRSNSAMLSQQPPSSLPRACTKAWSLDGACASWASRLAASEPPERHLRRCLLETLLLLRSTNIETVSTTVWRFFEKGWQMDSSQAATKTKSKTKTTVRKRTA